MHSRVTGLHAEIKKHPHSLVITSCLADGTKHGPVTIPMRKKDLLEAAKKGDFFSYIAGVAYKMLTDYQVRDSLANHPNMTHNVPTSVLQRLRSVSTALPGDFKVDTRRP